LVLLFLFFFQALYLCIRKIGVLLHPFTSQNWLKYSFTVNSLVIFNLFTVTSLSKIGFGDYVPRPNPPEQWARQEFGDNKENPNFETIEHKFDLTKCVEDIVGTSTKYFKVAGNPIDVSSKVYCRPTEWDNIYWLGYWLYRFLVFIWQLTGLSFSGTVVSMLVKKMQQVIPELFPCMVVDSEKPIHTFPSPYNRSLCPSRNALIG